MKIDYSLYLIMDDSICRPDEMQSILNEVIDCGITCVQLRMKKSPPATIYATGKDILNLLKKHDIPLLINDYVEIATALNADGVHIGQRDHSVLHAREILGNDKIIGLSIENEAQAHASRQLAVDYFGVGPIFTTSSKSDAAPAMGVEKLTHITALIKQPIVAIGGINQTNINEVLTTGVAGIAVISAILSAAHPKTATKALAQTIKTFRESHG